MKGILYRQNGHSCFILNHFVKQEDPELLEKLKGKRLAVTFETMLYYFQVSEAWYEHDELHVSTNEPVIAVNMLLAENWPAQLIEFADQQAKKYETRDSEEEADE